MRFAPVCILQRCATISARKFPSSTSQSGSGFTVLKKSIAQVTNRTFIASSKMAFHNSSLQTIQPKNYLMVGFPGFQLLDAAGPLDILGTITKNDEAREVGLTIAAETLDSVVTAPLAPRGSSWKFEDIYELPRDPAHGGMVGRCNAALRADTTFDEYLKGVEQATLEPPDVLIIPGGIGTRMYRLYEDGSRQANAQPTKDFVSKIVPHVKQAIMTVCTGSDLLGQTGLLDGRRATTNMRAFEKVAERNQTVNWQRARRWVRSLPTEAAQQSPAKHLEIWTSAGISAGIDLMLAFVAEVYGIEFARTTASRLEYEWREVPEGAVDSMYGLSEDEAGEKK